MEEDKYSTNKDNTIEQVIQALNNMNNSTSIRATKIKRKRKRVTEGLSRECSPESLKKKRNVIYSKNNRK